MAAERPLVAACCAALALAACARAPRPAPAPPLPALPVAQVEAPGATRPFAVEPADPLGRFPPGEPVTLSAQNVDVRALLPALAEAAGISLVLGPDVQGRVSVNLVAVPALDALRTVLADAGLAIASGPPAPPFGQVVFYTLPVAIDEASAELIQARFGVSPEVARWIVENRLPR